MELVSISIPTHSLTFTKHTFQSDIPAPVSDTTTTTMIPRRRRLLFTFGALILSVLRKILTRMHISTIPTGKNTKIMCAIEHQWLAILSFLDDHIIVFEDLTVTVFPAASHVFDKIDDLVQVSESFVPKMEDFIDNDVAMIMRRIPFVDRICKKEIVIDVTCHGYRSDDENVGRSDREKLTVDVAEKKKKHDDDDGDGHHDDDDDIDVEKKKEKEKDDDDDVVHDHDDDGNVEILYTARGESVSIEEIDRADDPIIELFEAGWHTSPRTLSTLSPTKSSTL